MIKRCCFVALCLFSLQTNACDLFEPNVNDDADSVLFHSSQGVCFSLVDGMEYNPDKQRELNNLLDDDEQGGDGYWSDWILNSETNPVLTQTLASSYFGIGVWMPSELEANFELDNAEAWIRNHGLQFSLGIGDKKRGEPRMRIDYRWHEVYEGDVMMQVELPF